MKVFITGHLGYIGVHLVNVLKQAGHFVTGCDLGLFTGCEWEKFTRPDEEMIKDIRKLTIADIEGHDIVMHLAAISNDPMGDLVEKYTYSINLEGSVNLARLSKKAGVSRFLFSGSCSVYGKGEKLDLDENARLNPVSAYAISKVEAEKKILDLSDDYFTTTVLRNSTAYGYSPMLRIDLVVNNLLACAFTCGDIKIMSDGTPWRPLIHCKDIAHAFLAFAEAPKEKIHRKSVNIGSNDENYQVKEVAYLVKKFLPDSKIVFTGEVGNDPRNYRVNFDLLNKLIPDFRLDYNLESGIYELYNKFKELNFSLSDFKGDKFVRIRTLKNRLNILGAI